MLHKRKFLLPAIMIPFYSIVGVCETPVVSANSQWVRTGYFWTADPYQVERGGPAVKKGAVVAFSEGVITGREKDPLIFWSGYAGSSSTAELVFDLTKDRVLDRVVIVARPLYDCYGIKNISVCVRSEKSDFYLPAGMQVWQAGKDLVFDLGKKDIRYVKICLARTHEFQFMPLNRVKFLARDAEPVSPSSPTPTAKAMQAELSRRTILVDRYGQYLGDTWPGKITSDKQLQETAAKERQILQNVKLDLKKFDRFGGIRSDKTFSATGFFRLEKVEGRWWFITPEGNRFILCGVDDLYNAAWATSTLVSRNAFEELPDPKTFAEAYNGAGGTGAVNFLVANLKRKYGKDFDNQWLDVMKKRLLDWGFNGNGKWAKHPRLEIPYISVLGAGAAKRIDVRFEGGYNPCDPFDPGFAKAVAEGILNDLRSLKNDPWLIGHTFENEKGWNGNVVKEIGLRTDGLAAKAALVDFLAKRYEKNLEIINRKFGTKAGTFQDLIKTPLDTEKMAAADVSEFIRLASRMYFEQVRKAIKQIDPNHLFLGSSLTVGWHSSVDWDTGGAEFLDAISLDYYSGDPAWIKSYHAAGKPILLLEFSFSAAGRGLSSLLGFCSSHRARGLNYRYYVENLAADPLMVGFGWFLCYDAPVTGRPDGENFNMGLLNVCDQPYEEMIEEMKKTNTRLFDLHAGKCPPVKTDMLK
jgi:hypothetical protein